MSTNYYMKNQKGTIPSLGHMGIILLPQKPGLAIGNNWVIGSVALSFLRGGKEVSPTFSQAFYQMVISRLRYREEEPKQNPPISLSWGDRWDLKVREARICKEERARQKESFSIGICLGLNEYNVGTYRVNLHHQVGNNNFQGKSDYWNCNTNNFQSTHRTSSHSFCQPEWRELIGYTKINCIYKY